MEKRHRVIIVGGGLAGLATAARLLEKGIEDIAMVTSGKGGTPLIAALNAVLPGNRWNDTKEQYIEDMMKAGYELNNRSLVEEMCGKVSEGIELLQRWGIEFATENGELKRRHVSGSTYPRSLCQTTKLIGEEISDKLWKGLEEKGVEFYRNKCIKLLEKEGEIKGITISRGNGNFENIYSDCVVAAWGGIGNLMPESTYPGDIDGRGIAMAYEVGAKLGDLEFLEFEPMTVLSPESAKGEPCPTAMLGEGAYLKNTEGERFLLKIRPQGEAGSPKTLINKAIWKEVAEGKGTKNGGVYVDLRHIPLEVLKSYPWFYNRVYEGGVDPKYELVEVGPMAHSHSGGIVVDSNYESNIKGFYAVGEAASGLHGACRMAGNAAAQALASGYICGEAIAEYIDISKKEDYQEKLNIGIKEEIRKPTYNFVKEILKKSFGAQRDKESLECGYKELKEYRKTSDVDSDIYASQRVTSAILVLKSAMLREESRGTHYRRDYPEMREEWKHSIYLVKGGEQSE